MKRNPKEKEIITQLSNGRKTWTELRQNVEMSRETLSLKLKKLMQEETVEKYGVVEVGKIVDYYDLVQKKEPEIFVKVPRMFENGEFIKTRENLDIEQILVVYFHHSLRVLMHFARKILDVRFAKELSPKRRIEFTENWIREAKLYATEWMAGFIDDIILNSNASWMEIFGTYEDHPKDLIKAMAKFSEMIEAKQKDREVIEVTSEEV